MSPGNKKYIINTPIIFERRPKKKRSSSSRDAQKVERYLSRTTRRSVCFMVRLADHILDE